MSQSSVIAAFLLVGFLVFITGRGELPQYLAVIMGGGTATTSSSVIPPINTPSGSVIQGIQNGLGITPFGA